MIRKIINILISIILISGTFIGYSKYKINSISTLTHESKQGPSTFIANNATFYIDENNTLWGSGKNDYGQLGIGNRINQTFFVRILDNVIDFFTDTDTDTYFAIRNDESLWAWGNNYYGQLGDGTNASRNNPVKIMEDVESVSNGKSHTLAIKTDGSLWAWGRNDFGQLGDGTTSNKSIPIKIMDDVQSVSTADLNTIVIKDDNTLWTWGSTNYGLLGVWYITTNQLTPIMIMRDVVDVKVKQNSSFAIKKDDSLWAWGNNYYGQLGDGSTTNSKSPQMIIDNIKDVSIGVNHVLAMKNDGSIWAWGNNYYGQLGDGTTINKRLPQLVLSDAVVIETGDNSSYAIKLDGSLWSWGSNIEGKLGDGSTLNRTIPTRISDSIEHISASLNYAAAITKTGSFVRWGDNKYGQLSDHTFDSRITPIKDFELVTMQNFDNLDLINIEINDSSSYIIEKNKSLWTVGQNQYGQLGDGTLNNLSTFKKILDNIDEVAVGKDYSLALNTSGELLSWGRNYHYTLGDGTTSTYRPFPQVILQNVIQISAGENNASAITSDGNLWMWGRNDYGQIGNGTRVDQNNPINVLSNVKKVYLKNLYTYAIKNDNTLWAWGSNHISLRGDGVSSSVFTSPVKVMDNVDAISVGEGHILVLKTDGSLWSWGRNDYGQIGNSTFVDRKTPVKIMDGVLSISANWFNSYAIKYDGTLWSWGYNIFGQVGDGTFIERHSPFQVMVNVTKALPSRYGVQVIKTDGSLWAWGNNNSSIIGDGTSTHRNLPMKILDEVITLSKSVVGNPSSRFALTTDGVLHAWGSNHYGQFGKEGITSSNMPIKVSGYNHIVNITNDNDVYVPIYKDAPSTFIQYSENSNSIISIKNQSLAGNISIDQNGKITSNENGVATIEITDSTGSVIFHTFNVFTYVEKPKPISKSIAIHTSNKPYVISVSNSQTTYLDGQSYFGEEISEEGNHLITMYDYAGFKFESRINVDYTPPVITVEEYNQEQTNQDITVSAFINEGILNNTSHTFTENGSFTFIATDAAGNVSRKSVTVTNIDKEPPIITGVTFNGQYNTSRVIEFDEGIVLLNGDFIESGHVIATEGSHVLIAVDDLGNSATINFTLDFTSPIITVHDYDKSITNQDIIVTVSTNKGTLNQESYTFTENGSFTFIATDLAGNVTEETVTISNIDKIPPSVNGVVDGRNYNSDRTITFTEGEAIINGTLFESGSMVTNEGSYTLVITDDAGNITSIKFIIDKTSPLITVYDYLITPTNQDITVTVSTNEGFLIKSSHTFTENSSFTFIAVDEAGNITEETVTITNIDKTPPVITVLPFSTDITHLPVTVSVTTNEGTLNKTSHTFTQNGSFTFIATDEAGNTTEETVTITHIVNANEIKSIEMQSSPTRTQYLQGQILDLNGGVIIVHTYGGSSTPLSITPSMVSGYNPFSTTYGPQTVTVTYGGKTTTFEVYLNRFSDVPYGHRNYAHINALVELGIINGYSDSTFRPNNTLTRAQAAIMIARAIGLSTEGVSSSFTDVPSTHAAYKFISAAQNAGIINGYSDGTFRPNASITRAQIAIMVQRAFQVQASGTPISFTDVPVGYAPKSFIETLASQRIVNGYSDGTFKPTNNVTRAQFSTMINNAIEYSKKR